MAHGKSYGGSTNRHVAGSVIIIAYLTRLVWPGIDSYLLEPRVTNVSRSNWAFQLAAGSFVCQIIGR